MTESQTSHDTPADVPIVAIGSSAGGITALQKLFEGLPASFPGALVVLQHLPPSHRSGLPNLIARWTRLPVRLATDGMRPEADTVYIPSPDQILTVENGVFRTRPAEGGGRRPGIDMIDAFLESLAMGKAPAYDRGHSFGHGYGRDRRRDSHPPGRRHRHRSRSAHSLA